jgi:hypothetical protein
MTPESIDALLERVEWFDRTMYPRPWPVDFWCAAIRHLVKHVDTEAYYVPDDDPMAWRGPHHEDGGGVAVMRNAAPVLAAEVRRLRGQVARLESALETAESQAEHYQSDRDALARRLDALDPPTAPDVTSFYRPSAPLTPEEINATRGVGPDCEVMSPDDVWVCTRSPGHAGEHIAGDSERVLARWSAAMPAPVVPNPDPTPMWSIHATEDGWCEWRLADGTSGLAESMAGAIADARRAYTERRDGRQS